MSAVGEELMEKLMGAWLEKGASYVECRAELTRSTTIEIRDEVVRRLDFGISTGLALRALVGGKVHFMTFALDEANELRAREEKVMPDKAWMIRSSLAEVEPVEDEVIVEAKEPPSEVPVEDKMSLALEAHRACSREGVKTTSTIYMDFTVEKHIRTSEGADVRMILPYALVRHEVTAKVEGRLNSHRVVWGILGGFELLDRDGILRMSEEAGEKAVEGAKVRKCPSGEFRVLLDGDLNHLLAHEALGHGAEADSLRIGSMLKGKMGKHVGSPLINVVDDGRFELGGVRGFGWIPYDDEGVPTGRTVIIERGVLTSYMTDRITASEFGLPLTGNARAQSWAHPPIVRMRNTFIEPSSPEDAMSNEELLEVLGDGLLLRTGRGGQVDPIRGTFTFGVQEVYRVEGGEITERLSNTSISGNILLVLRRISAIGREFDEPQFSAGFCGKQMQRVPVGTSGPWLLVEGLLVGG
ncbi:hypothetical protein DRO32_00540 [Candidatus Bathyarchaeota archaeon]|nr:MAG: hypothetical protein DRO32_00540 [Candidatus Bathyarchaeota archaeon]